MDAIVGIPVWAISVGLIVFGALGIYLVKTRNTAIIEYAIDSFDGSGFDLYITELAKDMSPEMREVLLDIASVASPATKRTPGDLDNKTLKVLEDYLNSRH
jgi:hypothetical protein